MHHKMTIKDDPGFTFRPFFASCSCGPQGNFTKYEDARAYLDFHFGNIAGGYGVTTEFQDLTAKLVEPATIEEEKPAPKRKRI